MKTKGLFPIFVLLAFPVSLFSQITREQADAIALEYIQKEVINPCLLYVNNNTPDQEGITLTTHNGETIKAKYTCRGYYLNENLDVKGPFQRRYLLVNENTGNLLEIITTNDFGPGDLVSWEVVSMPSGLADRKKDTDKFLFSGLLSDKDACRLNVSFLNAGIYMVNVSGETYKIIKN